LLTKKTKNNSHEKRPRDTHKSRESSKIKATMVSINEKGLA